MSINTHLALGRVSNLPTVWTNVLAAGALAGASLSSAGWLPLIAAMSLFYIAGMYYNDVCDAEYDAQHQPHRPIASGLISRDRVETFAFGYVVVGFLLVYMSRLSAPMAKGSGSSGWLVATLALLAFIIAYNRHHKNNPLSPLLMAGCRVSVLIASSYTLTATLPPVLLLSIVSMLCWLVGLTFFAKHEHTINSNPPKGILNYTVAYWPILLLCVPLVTAMILSLKSDIVSILFFALSAVIAISYRRMTGGAKGNAIALLIAGICLVDGIFLTWVWGLKGAIFSLLAFAATLGLQRWVSGT